MNKENITFCACKRNNYNFDNRQANFLVNLILKQNKCID